MTPSELHTHLEDRHFAALAAGGANPWQAGARMVGERLGMDPALALDAVTALGGVFAVVSAAPDDPRRFVVAEGREARAAGTAALLLACGCEADAEAWAGPDLAAWSLAPRGSGGGSHRVWRLTCACAWLGELRPDAAGVTRLWQDPHGWLRRLMKSAAAQAKARAARTAGFLAARAEGRHIGAALEAGAAAAARWAVEGRMVDGALVLDPAAIPWTRAGVLADAEAVEIMDAPADGPLGRALVRMNPRLGTARGVPLRGVVASAGRPAGRRAA